jgi:hypothetical protein
MMAKREPLIVMGDERRTRHRSDRNAIISAMATRVFISFDYDNDSDLRTLLANQAKWDNSPFEITDYSVREAFRGPNWQEQVRKRIRQVGQVAVICGNDTDAAIGVAAELKIAREEEKPYFLLWGRATGTIKKPTTALPTDKIYNWTWSNLKALIAGER